MPKIRNTSPDALSLPWLGGLVVHPDEVVTVPDEHVPAYTCQAGVWEPADEDAERIHDAALAADTAAAEGGHPALNASLEVWARYAMDHRGASPDDVAGMTRSDLIELYANEEG